jgi:nicotinamide-nucleotide amidase
MRAWVIIVGDEVLDGFVADANARWLARRLRAAGIALDRVSVVPDCVEVIAAEVRTALAAPRPSVVFTAGGVGGTWDDVTYEAVAAAIGVPLVVDPELAAPVRDVLDWTERAGYRLDDEAVAGMMRIATVPEGSTVRLLNRWLAGVHVDVDGGPRACDGAAVVMLPGPPGHLQAVVDELVVPHVLGGDGLPVAVAEVRHEYPETLLAGALARIRRRYGRVKAGSYPGSPMVVRFRGDREEVAAAAADLRAVLTDLAGNPCATAIREAWRHSPAWTPAG